MGVEKPKASEEDVEVDFKVLCRLMPGGCEALGDAEDTGELAALCVSPSRSRAHTSIGMLRAPKTQTRKQNTKTDV